MENKQDIVMFDGETYRVPAGHTEQEVREGLEVVVASIANARATSTDNGDGTRTWRFVAQAGTKG